MALAVGALVPVVLFSAVVVVQLARQERSAIERRLLGAARDLAEDTDRELEAAIRTLRLLGEEPGLDGGRLEIFEATARRVLATQPAWRHLVLLDRDGQQLVNTSFPPATALPRTVEPDALAAVLRTGAPTVGGLVASSDGEAEVFVVRVPIVREGAPRYVLGAAITPAAFAAMVAPGATADREWTRTLVDRSGRVVARTREPERFVGRGASASFLAHTRGAPEGLFGDTTLDGHASYVAFATSRLSGWTVSIVTQRDVVDAPLHRTLTLVAALGVLVLAASAGGALYAARRLARGIAAAAEAAETLTAGGAPRLQPTRVAEVARLGEALRRSAALLAARERERDEHLARAEAARADAERASRAKDEFLAMLGHELRNPLAPIVTALHLLALRGGAPARELAVIDRQVRHLNGLVDDLLDVARITQGKVTLRSEVVDLAGVTARALEMAAPLLEARRHAVRVDVPAGLAVRGDPVRLAQVVANLLTNAARYTPAGGHVLVAGAGTADAVTLSVSDDGRGLPPELLARVFDLFVQGPRGPDRHDGGLGLGLTLVRSLVQLHGGTVRADSAGPGRGSTFTVTLPRLADGAAAAGAGAGPGETAAPPASPRRRAPRPLRVLVVDDNRDAAELLADLLADAGHDVVTAHDGPAALACARGAPLDVALLDLGLPVMDGYELAERLRELLGERTPPLLALSGYGQPADLARGRAAGFTAHFVKPADPDVILAAVERAGRARPEVMSA